MVLSFRIPCPFLVGFEADLFMISWRTDYVDIHRREDDVRICVFVCLSDRLTSYFSWVEESYSMEA